MIVKTYLDVRNLLDKINSADKIVLDIETGPSGCGKYSALNVRHNRILGIGFAFSETDSVYFPIVQWNGYILEPTDHCEMINVILNSLHKKRLIAHNAYFDLESIRTSYGVDLYSSLHADTILLKHTVDEIPPFGLKEIAKKLYGVDATNEQAELKEAIKEAGGGTHDYFMASVEVLGKYCKQDCKLTFKIFNHYSNMLTKDQLESFFYVDEVMPLFRHVTVPMQQRGVSIDLELLESTRSAISADMTRLEDEIQSEIDPHLDMFNAHYLSKKFAPRRSGVFAQGIAEFANLKVPRTKTGKYQLTQKTLQPLADAGCKYAAFILGGPYLPISEVLQIQKMLFKNTGDRYMFNIQSKHHLKHIFFQVLGETPVSRTEKGSPQVDDKFLDIMADKHEWVSKLRTYNKLQKIYGTYVQRFLDEHENGVFYPSYKQHGTISGRYGSDLQQLPRPYEDNQEDSIDPLVFKYTNVVRKFFIAGKSHKFIDADYESLEPHVFAHVSGDEGLRDIFRKGHDFYSTIAIGTEKLENVSADKKADNYLGKLNKPLRQRAKAYSLGVPYGLGGYGLAKQLKVSQEQGEQLVKQYLDAFPGLSHWMKWSDEHCAEFGYIKSEAGRMRRFPKAKEYLSAFGFNLLDPLQLWKDFHEEPEKYSKMKQVRREVKNYLNNSKNFQIQSLSASIVNRAAIAINKKLSELNIDGYVCAQIHDQLVVRVPEVYTETCQLIVQEIMESIYPISISLRAPAEVGDNFYDAH